MLALADPAACARMPGMARRLRSIRTTFDGRTSELPLFEGRPSALAVTYYVVGTTATGLAEQSEILAQACRALLTDGLGQQGSVVGCGPASAAALAQISAGFRFLVFPTLPSPRESTPEARSLMTAGILAADVLVAPSHTAARLLEQHDAFAERASDQPIVAVKFGCDELPNDPAVDPALPHGFSTEAPEGKALCRAELARKLALAVDLRTLLLGLPSPVDPADATIAVSSLSAILALDTVVVVSARVAAAFADRIRVLEIEHPGKLAVFGDDSPGDERILRASTDAVLITDRSDLACRGSGLAQRYGALPIAPGTDESAESLVDFDAASQTGTAILYPTDSTFAITGAVQRAIALRASGDVWVPLVRSLLACTPRWVTASNRLEALRAAAQETISVSLTPSSPSTLTSSPLAQT